MISEYLDSNLILFFDVKSRHEACEKLIGRLDEAGKLFDKKEFEEAILKREMIASTGIGMGVAVPHARLAGFDEFFITVGIQQGSEGIEWAAMDGSQIRLIFMIGGPSNQPTEYLQILSKLTLALKNEARRKGLFEAETALDVIKLFKGC